jgi:intron-binding protein aquarius
MQFMQYYAPQANEPPPTVSENNADAIPSENGSAVTALNKANEHMLAEENGDTSDTRINNKIEEDTVKVKDDIMLEGNMTSQGNADTDVVKEDEGKEHTDTKDKMAEDNAMAKIDEENAEPKDKMEEE